MDNTPLDYVIAKAAVEKLASEQLSLDQLHSEASQHSQSPHWWQRLFLRNESPAPKTEQQAAVPENPTALKNWV